MADTAAADAAAKKAAQDEIKALVKEAIGEYVTEAQSARTAKGEQDAQTKPGGGFFDILGGLWK